MSNRQGKVFVISSPSGGGKTTVCNRLKEERFDIRYSISVTTRRPRSGERNGRDYYFINKARFIHLARRDEFLEWTDNFGNLYGTPRGFVQDAISKGEDIILSIDVKGAMQVKKICNDAILIFLLPPSMGLLKKRLKARRTEGKETLAERLRVARNELSYLGRYDYAILNDRLSDAVNTLKSVIIAERHKIR